MKFLFITFLLLHFYGGVNCARILGIFPMPAKSHYILGSSLMRGLAERGHDVTVISPFGEKSPPKGGSYRDIVLTGFLETVSVRKMNLFDMEAMNPFLYVLIMNGFGNGATEATLNHTNVQNLLKSNETFDVIILEQFLNDALKAFAHHYKAPLILFSTFGSNAWVNPLVANPVPPSYVPELMINFSPSNFWDRFKNTCINVFGQLNRHFLFFPSQNKIMKKYFPDAPDLNVLNYNASLVLLNSHISTNQAVPRVPNMIDIGGYHVKPSKQLPEDLQKFLDGARDGVIYFSMGSALRSADFPEKKRNSILRVFEKIKMKVLWKWEEDTLPGQLPNVKLGKWLPQQDILAHPNIKLFITHGGLLSLIESVYHGVPILAIPIFGDQKINAADAVWNGYGLSVPYTELNEANLEDGIQNLLPNPKFKENIKRRSAIMHDRRATPMDDAEYWIQYSIRNSSPRRTSLTGIRPGSSLVQVFVSRYIINSITIGFDNIASFVDSHKAIMFQIVPKIETEEGLKFYQLSNCNLFTAP